MIPFQVVAPLVQSASGCNVSKVADMNSTLQVPSVPEALYGGWHSTEPLGIGRLATNANSSPPWFRRLSIRVPCTSWLRSCGSPRMTAWASLP